MIWDKRLITDFTIQKNNGEAGAATTSDRKSLIDVIYSAIQEGSIVAYGDAVYDDEFRSPMTASEIKTIGGAIEETRQILDMDLIDLGYDDKMRWGTPHILKPLIETPLRNGD